MKPPPINCTLSITSVEHLSRSADDPKKAIIALGTRVLTFQWTGEPDELPDLLQRVPQVRQLRLAHDGELIKD